jgi:hypothetical protein
MVSPMHSARAMLRKRCIRVFPFYGLHARHIA